MAELQYIFGDGPSWFLVGMLAGLIIGRYWTKHDNEKE